MEDSGADGDSNCGGLAQGVSEKNIDMWPRDHSCDMLAIHVIAFCPSTVCQPFHYYPLPMQVL